MDGNDHSNITMCPVMHAKAGVRSNSDWWPNQLNLEILRQHSDRSNPLPELNYKDEVKKLDLEAVKEEIKVMLKDSKEWWPADYSGPLQLSVELGAARGLRLSPGDTIGIRVFGRDLTAEVSSIRAVEWGSFGIGSNTAFVFSPGTLEAANPFHIAIARTDGSQDRALIAALEQDFPDVLVFETRPALEAATKIFEDISLAVNAAASVVTIAGLLVLFGTLGVVARKRAKEAALLKTLGAERRMVLSLYAGEFAIAGGVGAGLGTLIGMVGSYPVIVSVFEARWHFPLLPVLALVGAALLTSAIGGLIVGLNTLSKSPAQVLRSV